MKEIGAIFVVSTSEIRTVQLAAIKRRYNHYHEVIAPYFNLYQYKVFIDI